MNEKKEKYINSGVFGESLPILHLQAVSLLDVRLRTPGVYVLDLDFLNPQSKTRVSNYFGAYFVVTVGVRNASKTLKLTPGVHAVLADNLQITAIGSNNIMFQSTMLAVASGAPAPVLPQWTEAP
jgi:hypothetical protein